MNRGILASLAAILVLGVYSYADDWTRSFPVSAPPDLSVTTSDANVEVQPWDKNTVDIQVKTENLKIGHGGLEVSARQDGNRIIFEARDPKFSFGIHFNWHQQENVTIHVPVQANLSITTGDGRIRISGTRGSIDLHSGDGSQEVDSVSGSLEAKAGDGAIRARGKFDKLDLHTGDGRIEATALPGSKTASDWSLHTGDGQLTLELPEDFAATVDLHTSDGHLDLDLPLSVTGRLDKNSVRGVLNGGGGTVTVRTGDGSIHLKRTMASI
jgi:hypothetical protein